MIENLVEKFANKKIKNGRQSKSRTPLEQMWKRQAVRSEFCCLNFETTYNIKGQWKEVGLWINMAMLTSTPTQKFERHMIEADRWPPDQTRVTSTDHNIQLGFL